MRFATWVLFVGLCFMLASCLPDYGDPPCSFGPIERSGVTFSGYEFRHIVNTSGTQETFVVFYDVSKSIVISIGKSAVNTFVVLNDNLKTSVNQDSDSPRLSGSRHKIKDANGDCADDRLGTEFGFLFDNMELTFPTKEKKAMFDEALD